MPDFRVYVAMDLKAKTPHEAVQMATTQLEYMLEVSNDDESCKAVFIEAEPRTLRELGKSRRRKCANRPLIVDSLDKQGAINGN